jgi:hypothetical protein
VLGAPDNRIFHGLRRRGGNGGWQEGRGGRRMEGKYGSFNERA